LTLQPWIDRADASQLRTNRTQLETQIQASALSDWNTTS